MPGVTPFRGVRYDPDRVDLRKVVIPAGLDDVGKAAVLHDEPRCALRFDLPRPARDLWRAELLRAGVLLRDDEPAFYVLRQMQDDDDEEDARLGLFAVLSSAEGSPIVPVGSPGSGGARCVFVDEKRKVRRILRAQTEERDPDARLVMPASAQPFAATEDEELELFVIDDETACARIVAQLAEALVYQVEGASPEVGDLVFFAPLDDGRTEVTQRHLVARLAVPRADLLDSARVFFNVEEADEEQVREAVAERRAAGVLDEEGAALLILHEDAPSDLLDLGGLSIEEAAHDAIVGAAARALIGEEASARIGSIQRLQPGPGEVLLLLPPPSLESDGLWPADTLALVPPVATGLVTA